MKSYFVLAGIVSLSASVLAAQSNVCPAGGRPPTDLAGVQANAVHDACTQAVDVFHLMAPQLGLALTGGNATLGQGGTLGGLGHFAIGVRANAFYGDLPQVNEFPASRTAQTQAPQVLPSRRQAVGFPVVDAAIGVFKGVPLGVTNVGGIDLLVNGAYVPSVGDANDDIRISPETNYKFGFGARVGLLQESLIVPGIAVTYIRRDLPATTISGQSAGVSIDLEHVSVKSSAWRVVAAKSFIAFSVAAGYGQDRDEETVRASGSVKNVPFIGGATNASFGPIDLSQDVTRSNMFADLSVNMLLFKIVGEVGRVSGGTFAAPTNTFSSGGQGDSRLYGSLGLRFGW